MTVFSLAYTLHVLAALIWVGGMFFAWMILRPAAGAAIEGAFPKGDFSSSLTTTDNYADIGAVQKGAGAAGGSGDSSAGSRQDAG